ncbi:MAG: hypothetical protein PHS62_03505 [Patescibacteria group bacterium]|nr:hypothetical protein [Patescibacteria group bacterium]
MTITICASATFTPDIIKTSNRLKAAGHLVNIPTSTQRIIDGELTLKEYLQEKEKNGDLKFRENCGFDLIKRYYDYIKSSDAILVLNLDKKGIKNYVGGNTLMEIGFAYILNKKIYFYNPIPKMPYTDELKAVQPIVINGNLEKII